ncbi:MAG: hypothetical protein HOP10_02670 [Chitinophagaceae bacterium]|nr:hypothetical protein [Chitinophagaceae bacterium]
MDELLYIEPGSGSYIIQVIVAAVLGAAFWIRMSWQRVKAFFLGRKYKPKDKEEKKAP